MVGWYFRYCVGSGWRARQLSRLQYLFFVEKDVLWEISNIKGLTVREILESHLLGHPFEGLFDIKDYTGSWCVFDLFPCIVMGNSLLQVMGTCRQGRRDFPRIIIFISSKGSGSTKRFDERNESFTLLFFYWRVSSKLERTGWGLVNVRDYGLRMWSASMSGLFVLRNHQHSRKRQKGRPILDWNSE